MKLLVHVRRLGLVLVVGIVTAFSGCVLTIDPLYTNDDVVVDEALVGSWWPENAERPWVIPMRDDTSFHITVPEKQGDGQFVGHLVALEDALFLDMTPDPEPLKEHLGPGYRLSLVPGHILFHVRISDENLELAPMNTEWFKTYVAAHPDAVSYTQMDHNPHVFAIRGSTEELQAFVLKHLDVAFTNVLSFSAEQKKTE